MSERRFSLLDHFLASLNHGLNALFVEKSQDGRERPNPSAEVENEEALSPTEMRQSAGLMRVNHCGEVCAQALYIGQSLTTRDPHLRDTFQKAAEEEKDHLVWCEQRLNELRSHTSYFNPLWYTGSLVIGFCASMAGKAWNLGFLAETEQQVSEHLERHLSKLPMHDLKSRVIVLQMQQDEKKHQHAAISLGAKELPAPIKAGMKALSKVMTTVAYYI